MTRAQEPVWSPASTKRWREKLSDGGHIITIPTLENRRQRVAREHHTDLDTTCSANQRLCACLQVGCPGWFRDLEADARAKVWHNETKRRRTRHDFIPHQRAMTTGVSELLSQNVGKINLLSV